MTDLLDDRLTAALHARANAVAQTYRPTPFVPTRGRRRRLPGRPLRGSRPRHASGTWRWLVPAALVSAAIVALVSIFVGGGHDAPAPAPAGGYSVGTRPAEGGFEPAASSSDASAQPSPIPASPTTTAPKSGATTGSRGARSSPSTSAASSYSSATNSVSAGTASK